jgi:molybdopterin-guanine dinucleotide biosynthesis protein A
VGETAEPLGVVLAGGAGARLGGAKAVADLAGRPLIAYPLAAFADAAIEAVVVAKADSPLPPLEVEVVTEPEEPVHPILGLVTALEHAGGRAVVSSPCDTPSLTPTLLANLAASPGTAVVHDGKRLHPLLARYEPSDLPTLRAGLEAGASATAVAESLSPALVRADPKITFNVNSPADLAYAASIVTRAL